MRGDELDITASPRTAQDGRTFHTELRWRRVVSTSQIPAIAPSLPRTPSVHVRALLTWLVIFPEVAVVNWALSPFDPLGPTVLRSLVVTAVVVPPAVYLFVPALVRLWTRRVTARFSSPHAASTKTVERGR